MQRSRRRALLLWVGLPALVAIVAAGTVLGVLLAGGGSNQILSVVGPRGSVQSLRVHRGRIGWVGSGSVVSCATPTWCVSVGAYNLGSLSGRGRTAPQASEERGAHYLYDGRSWTEMAPGNTANLAGYIADVSCPSPSFCVAVGNTTPDSRVDRTLIEAWNGRTWARVQSPNHGSLNNALQAVSCTSAHFCLTVGYFGYAYSDGTEPGALVEIFNGSHWTLSPTPSGTAGPGRANSGELGSVSCVSDRFCMVVGSFAGVYDNGDWRRVSLPKHVSLGEISCTSSDICTALGHAGGPPVYQSVVERYARGAWSRLPTVTPKFGESLSALTCRPRECFAVGETIGNMMTGRNHNALVEALGSPSPSFAESGRVSGMNSISCASPQSCLAVGVDRSGHGIYLHLSPAGG